MLVNDRNLIKDVPWVSVTKPHDYIPAVNPPALQEGERAYRQYKNTLSRTQYIDLLGSILPDSLGKPDSFRQRLVHNSGSCTCKR